MNASKSVVSVSTLLRASTVAAAALVSVPLHAEFYEGTPLLAAGISPSFSAQPPLDVGLRIGRGPESPPRPVAQPKPSGASAASSVAAGLSSSLKYAFFCFGPVFGNASREVDPNFMPLPTASDGSAQRPGAGAQVHYTRVPASSAEQATWVGSNGSRISYRGKLAHGEAPATPANNKPADAKSLSVEDIIAENRKELTNIAWTRTYRRFPELGRPGTPERQAFESYLLEKQSNTRDSSVFESPMWPEALSSEFMTTWNWKKTEEESWERVRAKVRAFNDPESPYARRFLAFMEVLRADPDDSAIFKDPTWPEKALELHDQKLGPVPPQFR